MIYRVAPGELRNLRSPHYRRMVGKMIGLAAYGTVWAWFVCSLSSEGLTLGQAFVAAALSNAAIMVAVLLGTWAFNRWPPPPLPPRLVAWLLCPRVQLRIIIVGGLALLALIVILFVAPPPGAIKGRPATAGRSPR